MALSQFWLKFFRISYPLLCWRWLDLSEKCFLQLQLWQRQFPIPIRLWNVQEIPCLQWMLQALQWKPHVKMPRKIRVRKLRCLWKLMDWGNSLAWQSLASKKKLVQIVPHAKTNFVKMEQNVKILCARPRSVYATLFVKATVRTFVQVATENDAVRAGIGGKVSGWDCRFAPATSCSEKSCVTSLTRDCARWWASQRRSWSLNLHSCFLKCMGSMPSPLQKNPWELWGISENSSFFCIFLYIVLCLVECLSCCR